MKKLVLAASVAAMFGAAVDAQAGIAFYNNGSGPLLDASSFQIAAGNYLFQGLGPNNNGNDFNFFGQSVISGFNTTSGIVNAAPGFEYTVVIGRTLVQNLSQPNAVTGVQQSLAATLEAAPSVNFFNVYYGSSTQGAGGANNQSGTGFNDGTLILSGTVANLNSFTLSNNSSFQGPTAFLQQSLQLLDNRPGGTFTTTTTADPADPAARTDPTMLTINTTGSADFLIDVTSSNPAFFNGAPNFINANFTVDPNSQFNTPFTTIAPSTSFTALGASALNHGTQTQATAIAGLGNDPTAVPGPGTGLLSADPNITSASIVNGLRCTDAALGGPTPFTGVCDFTAQGSGSASMSGNFIPEPGSLALLGLGLALSGMMAKRRTAATKALA